MKTKIIIAAGLLILGGLLAWYVQALRADNAELQNENAKLYLTLATNMAIIEQLKGQRLQDEALLQQWANDQERIKQLQNQLTKQIQRELQNNEDFKNWAGGALPDSALRLLQSANNN